MYSFLIIEHKLATPLELVGTQVTLLKSIQLRSPGPTSSQYFQSYNFRQKLLTFEIMTRLVPIDTVNVMNPMVFIFISKSKVMIKI